LQTTKEHILAYLKQAGVATVDGLATELGLARMTIRQHLTVLERDALVQSREERRSKGRPRLVFTLTEGGQERFPKQYERLADLVLQEVAFLDPEDLAGLDGDGKKRLLLEKMAERVYREHESKVKDRPLPERVAIVTDILKDEGGFADWSAGPEGYEIADHNCVYRRVVDSHPDICTWHVSLLARLLDSDVECSEFMRNGADACRFVVRREGTAQVETKGQK
jgi:predicted ArsR family transcriptional regulator